MGTLNSTSTIEEIQAAYDDNAFLPEGMMRTLGIAAEKIAVHKQKLSQGTTFICQGCGYAARRAAAVAPRLQTSGQHCFARPNTSWYNFRRVPAKEDLRRKNQVLS